eukprot:1159842-Pelagomonas_calceolata.AAC.2
MVCCGGPGAPKPWGTLTVMGATMEGGGYGESMAALADDMVGVGREPLHGARAWRGALARSLLACVNVCGELAGWSAAAKAVSPGQLSQKRGDRWGKGQVPWPHVGDCLM